MKYENRIGSSFCQQGKERRLFNKVDMAKVKDWQKREFPLSVKRGGGEGLHKNKIEKYEKDKN